MMVMMPRSVRDELLAHARIAWPEECCGLLAGRNGTFTRAVRITNLAGLAGAAERSYVMDPRAVLDALQELEAEGVSLLGVYHSHPCSVAVPSRDDALAAVRLDLVQVIVSLENQRLPDLRAFRLHDHAGSWTEVFLRIVDDQDLAGQAVAMTSVNDREFKGQ